MNDIKLKKINGNTFDWSFNKTDLDNVIGYQSLVSAVTHTIFLKKGELEQELYYNKGSNAQRYANLPCDNTNMKLIKSELETEIKDIIGVSDAKVTITNDEYEMIIQEIEITTNEGGVLKIGV